MNRVKNLKPVIDIIADDFGIAKGVNKAILELYQQKMLDGVSVMTTADFYQNDILKLKQQADNKIKIGLHIDLTFGKSNFFRKNTLLTNDLGIFKNSFFKLFLLSIFQKKFLVRLLYKEINSQLKTLSNDIGKINYLDGHQHIHTIPLIFKITKKLANKYQIKRLRIINENFFSSFNFQSLPSPVSIVKFAVLKLFYLVNQAKNRTYFYSILYSCKIDEKAIKNFTKLKQENIEIMMHPGYSQIDRNDSKNREFKHISSKYRDIEREQIANLNKLKTNITINNR